MPRRLPSVIEQSEGSFTYAVPDLSFDKVATSVGGKERSELIISQGNPFPYRNWGSFYKTKRWYRVHERTQNISMRGPKIGAYQWRCNGPVCLGGVHGLLLPTAPGVTTQAAVADPFGSVGWNRTRPTREVASALVAFGEVVKDGLPSLPGDILGGAIGRLHGYSKVHGAGEAFKASPRRVGRALGSEYLNYDFGWRPMVEDAMKLMDFTVAFAERLKRWERQGNSRTIRRSIVLRDSTTSSSTFQTTNIGGFLAGCGSLGTWIGVKENEVSTHSKIWYEAGYRLNIPDLTVPLHYYRTMLALLGATPSPDVVWKLTPWSWLTGWFSSFNDAVSNTFDPLGDYFAAAYAFVMFQQTVQTRVTVSAEQASTYYGGPFTVTVGGSMGYETKYRRAASPFGFGDTWDGLSARQVATAAALGISRA